MQRGIASPRNPVVPRQLAGALRFVEQQRELQDLAVIISAPGCRRVFRRDGAYLARRRNQYRRQNLANVNRAFNAIVANVAERLPRAHVMIISARAPTQCRTMSCRVLNFACRLQSHNIICVRGNRRNQGLRSGKK